MSVSTYTSLKQYGHKKTTNSLYLTMSSASGLCCAEKELTGSEIGFRAGTVVILTGSSATTQGVTSSLQDSNLFIPWFQQNVAINLCKIVHLLYFLHFFRTKLQNFTTNLCFITSSKKMDFHKHRVVARNQ